MIYQNPQLLFGLFAIAIPILIHLFNFRKHENVFFSSIRFLEEIKTKNNKKRNIKNLLILISRIFAISFLVLAFAKPYIPVNKEVDLSEDIFIYLDNSFSMDAVSEQGRLLDIAKNKAIEITRSYSGSSKFYLITNDFLNTHNKGYSKENFKQAISSIETSPNIKSLSQIIDRKQTISNNPDYIYIISDLQKNTLKITQKDHAINDKILFIPLQGVINSNLSVDSVWVEGPVLKKNNQEVFIKITNYSDDEKEIPLSLRVNNKTKIKQLLSINKNSSEEYKFSVYLDSSINICEFSIVDHPITFDNQIHFNLINNNKINILNIKEKFESDYIQRLYKNDTTNFKYSEKSIVNLNYQEIKEQDLLIINEIQVISSGLLSSIKKLINKGGSIIIIPPININYNEYKEFLSSLELDFFLSIDTNTYFIKKTHVDHPIFNNVFEGSIKNISYPKINSHYSLSKNTKSNRKPIYTLENNETFLSHYNTDDANIYIFNAPLNDAISNFKKHALFVPTFLNIATNSINQNHIYYTIQNGSYFISENNNNNIYHLRNRSTDIIPTTKTINGKTRYYTNNQISKSGQYKLYNNTKVVDHIAYNYNNIESDNRFYEINEIKKLFDKNTIIINKNNNINQLINANINDQHYWKTCLMISLLFFGIEILLLKLIKI
jgi:hypothetical protein